MDHENGEYKTICDGLLDGYKGIVYGVDDEGTEHDDSCTMQKVVIKDGKVVSVSGELTSLKNEIIAILGENNNDTIVKTDNKTNIKLEAASDVIPDNTTMDITEIISGETFNKLKDTLLEIKNFKAYDITLKSNETNIQPNGKIKISIPIPEGFDTSRLVIYRFEEDGSKTEYQVAVLNGYATFETDHFSTYVLGEKLEASDEKQDKTDSNIEESTTENNDTKLPQTGEETNTFVSWLSMLVILGIFWLGSMLLIDREKKKMIKK